MTVPFRVEDFTYFKLNLSIHFNWWGWGLCLEGKGVGCHRFQLRYVEDQVDHLEVLWES